MNAQDIRTTIQKIAEEKLNIYIPISISETNFGTSMYIQNIGIGKIRISDHSVTNFNRIWDEIHYDLFHVTECLDRLLLDIEMLFFPERFKKVKYTVNEFHYTRNLFLSIEEFNEKIYNSEIVSTEKFVTKKGIEKIWIEYKYPVQIERTKMVRK